MAPHPTKLHFTRQECENQINARISKISPLITQVERDNADFHEEYETFQIQIRKWREYNFTLLQRMFEDPSVAENYRKVRVDVIRMVNQDDYETYLNMKKGLNKEIGYLESCIEKLPLFEEPSSTNSTFAVGETFDAFTKVNAIIGSAKHEILLIDGYINSDTLNILSVKQNNVAIRILTKPQSVTPNLTTALKAFVTQHGSCQLRTSNDVHDRFMVIDGVKIFQSGASIKDIGKKASTLIEITGQDFVKATLNVAETAWQNGTP